MHYGRLGMKWGKHIFGDDPRWGRNGRKTRDESVKSAPMGVQKAFLGCNKPSGKIDSLGRTKNCTSCVVAYDLRRRGYNVRAKGGSYFNFDTMFKDVYGLDVNSPEFNSKCKPISLHSDPDDPSPATKSDLTAIQQMLPPTARGVVIISRPKLPGHVLNWETKNGLMTYLDSQNTEHMNRDSFLANYKHYDLDFIRVDNCDVNEKKISKWTDKG